MIGIDNTKTGFTRAFTIIGGLAIATVTAAQADSSTRKDRCPYYPSPVACRGSQSAATGVHQWAQNFRRKSSASHHTRK
jgi:hypothetical protein